MRTIEELLGNFNESHQNATNKSIHKIAVPLAWFSILGIFYGLSFPGWTKQVFELFSWAFLLMLITFVYYFLKSFPIAITFLAISICFLLLQDALVIDGNYLQLIYINLILFAVAALLLKNGNSREKHKSSLIMSIMDGPAWFLSGIWNRWHVNLDI